MPGTFIAVRVHPITEEKIREYIKENNIPLVYPEQEARRHATVIYAPNHDFVDDYKEKSLNPLVKYWADPGDMTIFPTQTGGKCLVLKLICPELIEKNAQIMKWYKPTVTHAEYKPHITFSYDVGDFDPNTIPKFTAPIILHEEYCEPIKENWVAPTAKKD